MLNMQRQKPPLLFWCVHPIYGKIGGGRFYCVAIIIIIIVVVVIIIVIIIIIISRLHRT